MTWNPALRSNIVDKVLSVTWSAWSKRKLAFGVLALTALAALIFFGATLWRASGSLRDARALVAREGRVPFRTISLDRPASTKFETISSPALFRDATLFQGRLYLCGPAGLFAYDLNGSPIAQYHPGRELPPAPLVSMAAAVASGTSDEQLWIATSGEGLLAFDGRKFTQIRPADDSRNLTSILPLSSGRLLLGTEKSGILVWDGQNLTRYHPSLNDLQVTALAGAEPDLWIGTIDRGVYRWHAGQLDHFAEGEGLPDPRVLSLAVDGSATYAGTALGVAEFRDGRFNRLLADGFFARSLLVKNGSLAIGTLDEGVIDIPLAAQKPRPRMDAEASTISGVERLLSLDGRTYALARGGLYQQSSKSGEFTKVFDTPGAVLADGNVSALAVDPGGRLWVGYFDRGLDILDPGFEHATHLENENLFCINRIVHGGDGSLSAVGTANGLVLFDGAGHQKQVLGKAEGLIANQVTDILLRGDGRAPSITIATPAGITTIDSSGTSSLYAFHGLVNNHVYALASSGSRVMAGTLGGLSILDSGIVKASFTTANSGLKHNWITAIVPIDGDWFVGTYGAGVMKFDSTGRWSTFADWKAPAEINNNAMLVTDRAVYAGTLGRGLAIFNRATGRWTFHTAGLPSLNVTALAANRGYLYIGADNGLVRIEEKDLVAQ
jgi:ligand-binding sensor domain-containing protein